MFKSGIKNRFKALIAAIIMLLFCFSMPAQKNFTLTKKYAPAQLLEDATIITDAVLKMHPVIGIYYPKSYYETVFNRLKQSITDSLTEKQFRLKLKLAFDELHCGHTEIWNSKAYSKLVKPIKLNFVPYYMVALDKKLYVATSINPKKDSLLKLGTEILKINDIPVDSILNYSMHFISGDGYNTTGKQLYLRTGLNYSYPSLFGRPDSFIVETKYKDQIQTHCVRAISLKDLPSQSFQPKTDSTFKKYRKSNISSGYFPDDKSVAVLKIKSFKSVKYKKVYRRYFKKIKNENIQHLVIDLRYNGGGNLMNSYRLLSYFLDKPETVTLKTHIRSYPKKKYTRGNFGFKFTRWVLGIEGKKTIKGDTLYYTHTIKPRKKNHYNNKVYVLTNGGTFSASCIVAAYLKQSNKAILIGSETGGAREGCNAGVTPYYTLPNTKIKVRVPAFRIIHDINPSITGKGISPDYEVNYSLIDFLSRKDLEFKKVKELIKQ